MRRPYHPRRYPMGNASLIDGLNQKARIALDIADSRIQLCQGQPHGPGLYGNDGQRGQPHRMRQE